MADLIRAVLPQLAGMNMYAFPVTPGDIMRVGSRK